MLGISILLSVILAFSALSSEPAYAAISAGFTNDQNLYFTGTSSDPATLYQDAMDGNLDAGIQICDLGSRYVGAFYAMNTGTWNYALISYSSFSNALAETTVNAGGGCYQTSPGFMTVSPSQLTTPSPYVYKAAFPGKLFIGYDTTANPGTISEFVFANTAAQLLGDYTVTRSFSQATRAITIGTPTISFETSSGTFSATASHASFGINSERRMVIGVCSDQYGEACSDGNVFTSASFSPFDTGLLASEVDDQHTYTRYVVLNGIGKAICIGSNLKATINSISPDPVYYSQTLEITLTLTNDRDSPYETNGGNVNVTNNFNVKVSIYNSSNPSDVKYSTTFLVSTDLAPDGYTQRTVTWPAYAHSGFYTVLVEADYGDSIVECNEADNTATDTFELKPITLPTVLIDGEESTEFPYPNVPYALDLYFRNSDNTTLKNATVSIVEGNGLSLMAPSQTYNITYDRYNHTKRSGLVVQNKVTFVTDYFGNASFTFVPTYNRLYSPEYEDLGFYDHVGNYSLYLEGVQEDNESFVFIIDGDISSTYDFTIGNVTYAGEYEDKDVYYENMTSTIYDFIYHTFTNFLETLLDEF